jgi:hypothetical protein
MEAELRSMRRPSGESRLRIVADVWTGNSKSASAWSCFRPFAVCGDEYAALGNMARNYHWSIDMLPKLIAIVKFKDGTASSQSCRLIQTPVTKIRR